MNAEEMPTEMKIICPHCGYDHADELLDLEAWVSDSPYETECGKCFGNFVVHTHVTYSFTVSNARSAIVTTEPHSEAEADK